MPSNDASYIALEANTGDAPRASVLKRAARIAAAPALLGVVCWLSKRTYEPWPKSSNALGATSAALEASLQYTVDLRCEGKTFFDCFDMHAEWNCVQAGGTKKFWSKTIDCSEGPAYYVGTPEEVTYGPDGLIDIHDEYVVMRAGKLIENRDNRTIITNYASLSPPKALRESVRLTSKKSWKYMLLVMKYNRLPAACGSWPAFWVLGPGEWPAGGELDIMEWSNLDNPEMTSLHTSAVCKLDPDEVNRFAEFKDVNYHGGTAAPYDCQTEYPDHLGCGPNRVDFNSNSVDLGTKPGVFAMEWTPEVIKVFHFKEHEIPADLEAEDPQTGGWNANLIGYYPFARSKKLCPTYADVLKPQTIRLNQAYCGDLATFVGWKGKCEKMAKGLMGLDVEDDKVEAPCQDFMLDHAADEYMWNNAYWNISYIKVFKTPLADEDVVA